MSESLGVLWGPFTWGVRLRAPTRGRRVEPTARRSAAGADLGRCFDGVTNSSVSSSEFEKVYNPVCLQNSNGIQLDYVSYGRCM